MSMYFMIANRTLTLAFAGACSLLAQAQVEQRVNLLDGSVINHPVNAIDSITFSTAGPSALEIHLMDNSVIPVELVDVDTVAFGNMSTWTFEDPRDGNVYAATTIGDQCWMAENLRYLPNVVGGASGSAAAWLYYVHGYNGTNVNAAMATSHYQTYGVLYNWRAAMQGAPSSSTNPSGVQGACPPGWHLPSDAEVKQLELYLGLSQSQANNTGYRGTNQGSRLAGNAGLWENGDLKTHQLFGNTGFDALPGSLRSLGTFGFSNTIGEQFGMWTATENGSNAWFRNLYYTQTGVYRSSIQKEYGMSLRCVCDQ